MTENNKQSTILVEHRKVASTRYILALINFIAILLGTVLTLVFVKRRGIYTPILVHIYILLAINAVQVALSLTEFILRRFMGVYAKWLPIVSYSVGAVWIVVLISEMFFATNEIGTLRIDLLVVAAIQLVIALIAYLVWPMMDRKAIDAMTARNVREDETLRLKKAKKFVTVYGVVCGLIVLVQAATLFVYKMPPTFYDLFSDTRALQYEYNEEYEGYFVKSVYKGTSTVVNIPATYNNLPVVGLDTGALVDENISEQYKFTEITFGTEETDAEGNTRLKSNLRYIAAGAINNNKIESIVIPASVEKMERGAIVSNSIKTINYAAKSDFNYGAFQCSAVKQVIMSGEDVGKIASLEGMAETVEIKVDKDIYNAYRAANANYVSSFSPIMEADEFCIDFFTNCDYYIDSIFKKVGESTTLLYSELSKAGQAGNSLAIDTKAYIENAHEVNTDGAKPNSAFRGWYTDAAYTNEFKFTLTGSDTITKNIKLYAKWIDEYTGTLNWGTHTPEQSELPAGEEVLTEMHWTDEDKAIFPVVTNRLGYTDGVVWTCNGTAVKDSTGISQSVRLDANWKLDAPTVSIEHSVPEADKSHFTINGNQISFTYNETGRTLELSAKYSHVLSADGMEDTSFTRTWIKEIQREGQEALDYDLQGERFLDVKNFVEGGKYTLEVEYTAPAGEKTKASATVIVNIKKKALEHSEVFKIDDKNVLYNGLQQSVDLTGEMLTENVSPTYSYINEEGEVLSTQSAKNAGKYTVKALFAKNNAVEALNYETKELTATLTIAPATIRVTGWKNDANAETMVYKAAPYTVTAVLEGLVDGESANLVYKDNTKTNAGSYTSEITACNNGNYYLDLTGGHIQHDWTIEKKALTVSAWTKVGNNWSADWSAVYDGTKRSLVAQPVGVCGSDQVSFTYENTGLNVNGATAANAVGQKYKACVNGTNDDNYSVAADTYTQEWTITKRVLDVNFDALSLTYNGNEQNLTATVGNFAESDKELLSGANIFDYTNPNTLSISIKTNEAVDALIGVQVAFKAKNAGDYTMAINGIANETLNNNYVIETPVNGAFTIAKKGLSIEETEASTREYNGKEQTVSLAVKGIAANDLEGFAVNHFDTTGVLAEGSVSNGAYLLSYRYTNAGNYSITVSALNANGNSNYTLVQAVEKTLKITPKALTLSEWTIKDLDKNEAQFVSMSENAYEYNHNGYQIGYELSGVQENDVVALTLTDAEKSAAGTYTTTASLDGYSNYTFTSVSKSWQISKKALTVAWENASGLVYNGSAQAVTPVISGIHSLDDGSQYMVSNNEKTNAGDYTASVALTGTLADNYSIASGATKTWKIAPKALSLAWTSLENAVYNGTYQSPSFTVGGLIGADTTSLTFTTDGAVERTISGIVNGTPYSFTSASGFAVNAGSYRILKDIVVGNGNYTLTDAEEESFTISPKEISLTGTWTATNNGIVVTGQTHTYNRNNYIYTTAITDGEIVEHLGTSVTLSLNYENNRVSEAGSYTAKVTGLNGFYASNYTLKTEGNSKNYTIKKKGVTLSWSSPSLTYNAGTQSVTASISTGGATAEDGKAYEGIYVSEYSGERAKNAGNYTAKALSLSNPNYEITGNASFSWSIAKKVVDALSWDRISFVYNAQVQYPTASYYLNGETVTVSEYEGNTTSKNVGNYSVKAVALDNDNYVLVTGGISQTYSITKCPLSVTWSNYQGLVYNGSAQTVTATLNGVQEGDEISCVVGNATYTNAGTYEATISSLTGDNKANYEIVSGESRTYTISQQTVSVVWGTTSFEYDGTAHQLSPMVKGSTDGKTVAFTQTNGSSPISLTNAGAIDITLVLNNANYRFNNTSDARKELTVTQQAVTVVWGTTTSFTYDGTPKSVTVTSVKGSKDGKSVDYFLSNQSKTDAGTYTATIALNDSNYSIGTSDKSKTYTIAKQKVTVTWETNTTKTYNSSYQKLAVMGLTGAVSGSLPTNMVSVSGDFANCGTNNITATLTSSYSSNYELVNPTCPLTIVKQKVTVTWETNTTKPYNGSSQKLAVMGLTGAVSGSLPTNMVSVSGGGTNCGKYLITAALTSSYSNNYELVGSTCDLTIEQLTVDLAWTGSNSYTYNGTEQGYTVQAKVNGSVVSGVLKQTMFMYTDAGSYVAKAELSDSVNYKFATSTLTKSFSISKREIVLSWNATSEMVYNGFAFEQPTADISNLVGYNDDVQLTYSLTVMQNTSYVSASEVKNAGNYKVTVDGISGGDAGNYTILGSSDLSKTFSVEKANLSVIWTGTTEVVYDGVTDYANAQNRWRFINDECSDMLSGCKYTIYRYNESNESWTAALSAKNVGKYRLQINLSNDAKNNFAYEDSDLSIEFEIVAA